MSVLFVISRLQNTPTVFRVAERSTQAGVKVMILFTEGGCRHAIDRELVTSLSYAEGLFCMEPDFDSLGLREKIDGRLEPIDYGGWIELVEACDRIVSWA
jgi:sulfur transfer complex TusBCD TusB component (DsrH family)